LLKTNDGVQLQFEQLFLLFPEDVMFIVDDKYKDDTEYYFRYCFDEIELCDIGAEGAENVESENEVEEIKHHVKKVTDLSDDDVHVFLDSFSNQLYGHAKFKDDFANIISSFRIFNKIGEHKILSLFLMGDSGIGKTEVARALHKALGSKRKLAKINFGNYSSHDALNSLIGSPLGYIGSDGGELLKRILESDVGVILIDEFEKADSAVYNYFLDVLENGKVTNTRAEEYDVDGFVIVFTSNISKENFENKISPELRSRFDYVGVFNLLTEEDKTKFVKYRFSEIITKYECEVKTKLPASAHTDLVSKVNVSKYNNMRHLNKKIKDVFVKYVHDISNEKRQ
jgi:ATP-dependent Clp protease ATP-binding subunit ClpC